MSPNVDSSREEDRGLPARSYPAPQVPELATPGEKSQNCFALPGNDFTSHPPPPPPHTPKEEMLRKT